MSNDRFDKFTERARKVLTLAQEEATRFNHNYIGTEHLLLGLVREGEGVAAKVLAEMGVEINQVRGAVEFIIGRGDRMLVGEIGLTPRAKKVIELAVDEARRLGHHYVGTEHLLLGLVREGEGIAAAVLESLGVSLEKVRAQTVRVLSQSSGTHPGTTSTGAPVSGSGPLEYGPEQALPLHAVPGQAAPARQGRWDYCLVHVAYPDPDESGMVRRVQGGGDEGRFGRDTTPIHQALQALGAEGWELVAVDTAPRDSGSSGGSYVLKRAL